MAQRRMFSRKITESDSFLDLPMSTQALYFHINMQADDDGFVGNAKTIKRMIGASDDDLRLLISKEFLIPFDTGVVVVKDWRIHNYIRKDRKTETFYKYEQSMLEIAENEQYELVDQSRIECQPTANQLSTNCQPNDIPMVDPGKDRRGEDRLDKYRTGQDRVGEGNSSAAVASDAIHDAKNDELKDLYQFYQENFGIITPYIQDDIRDYVDIQSSELVRYAMEKALDKQKPWSYAKGILKNWLTKNIKTLDQAQAEEVQFNNSRKNREMYVEPVPEWMKQQGNSKQSSNTQVYEEIDEVELMQQLNELMGG